MLLQTAMLSVPTSLQEKTSEQCSHLFLRVHSCKIEKILRDELKTEKIVVSPEATHESRF